MATLDLAQMVQESLKNLDAQTSPANMKFPAAAAAGATTVNTATQAAAAAQFAAGQATGILQDKLDSVRLAADQRQTETAQAVVQVTGAASAALNQGRDLLMAETVRANQTLAKAQQLEDTAPSFLESPIGYIANRWKAARAKDEYNVHATIAQQAAANINTIVQTTGAQVQELIQTRSLVDAAANKAATDAAFVGYSGTQARLQGASDAASKVLTGSNQIYEEAHAAAEYALKLAENRQRGEELKLRQRDVAQEAAAVNLAVDFMLKKAGLPRTADNLTAFRTKAEGYMKADPKTFAALTMAGAQSVNATDGQAATTHYLNSGVVTVEDAQRLGAATGDDGLTNIGRVAQQRRATEYSDQLKQSAYITYKQNLGQGEAAIPYSIWVGTMSKPELKQIELQAQTLAAGDVGNTSLARYADSVAATAPISSSRLNMTKLGVPEASLHYGFAAGSPEAKAVNDPQLRMLLTSEGTRGGASNGTWFQIPALYEAFLKAGSVNPAKATARILADEGLAAVRDSNPELKALTDAGLSLNQPAMLSVDGINVPVGDPVALQSLMTELRAKRDKKPWNQIVADWARRLSGAAQATAISGSTDVFGLVPNTLTKDDINNGFDAAVDKAAAAMKARTQPVTDSARAAVKSRTQDTSTVDPMAAPGKSKSQLMDSKL